MTDPNDSAIRWMILACGVAGAALAFALRPVGAADDDAPVMVAMAGVTEAPAAVWSAGRAKRAPRARPVHAAHPRPARRYADEPMARPRGPAGGAAVVAAAVPAGACPPGDERTRTMSMDDGRGTRRVEWADASCAVEVVIEGEVTFNADFTEFATISSGGAVRISERGDGVDRQLEVRSGSGGALTYRWRESGREAPFDEEARAWLRRFVPELLRTSGIAASERTAWLVRTQGDEGLFREIPLVRGDRSQRKYLEAWFDLGAHDAVAVARALEVAGAELKSDRELAAALRRLGPGELGDGAVRRAFLGATGSIESDRELAGLLTSLMDRESLSGAELEMVLESSRTIGSDRELSAVLLAVISEGPIEGRLRDPFMEVLGTIQSDRDYGRVASALLSGTGG